MRGSSWKAYFPRIGLAILQVLSASIASATEYEGEAKKYIAADVFKCPGTEQTFRVPKLDGKKISVRYREAAPGITWELMFAAEYGQMASVTYTKIRAEYPKTDAILHRTAANIKGNLLQEGGYVEWCDFLSDKPGQVLQCVIRYPNAGQSVSVRNKWLNSMETMRTDVYAIRHYLVREGYFLEFNVIFPQMLPKGSFDEDEYLDSWAVNLHDFVKGAKLVSQSDGYAAQVKNFTRPKSYFRFVFVDPARG